MSKFLEHRKKISAFIFLILLCGYLAYDYQNIRDYLIYTVAKIVPFESRKLHSRGYQQQVDAYCQENKAMAETESIIFLGDSLIHKYDLKEAFGCASVLNRGINADTTKGVLARIDANVNNLDTVRALFLMIGYNDLKFRANKKIIANIRLILEKVQAEKIFLLSVLPVSNKRKWFNHRIRDINGRLEQMAAKAGINFIDIHGEFMSEQGGILKTYTSDGTHLTSKAYLHWTKIICKETELGLCCEG